MKEARIQAINTLISAIEAGELSFPLELQELWEEQLINDNLSVVCQELKKAPKRVDDEEFLEEEEQLISAAFGLDE